MATSMYRIIRWGIGRVDGVNAAVSREVSQIIRDHGDGPITLTDAQGMMRKVDKVIDANYGRTPAKSRKSRIFREITRSTDLATETSFRNVYSRIRNDVDKAYPGALPIFEARLRSKTGDPFAHVYMSLFGPDSRKRAIAKAGLLDPDRRWVSPDGYKLSERVWRGGRLNRRRIDTTIRQGIAHGEGTDTIARKLEQFLDPKYAPVEYLPDGRIVRKSGPLKRNSSGASAARRLVRTEVKHMSDVATAEAVESTGITGRGVRWALSNAHPKRDICDTLASRSTRGLPKGVYAPEDFPAVPHPYCMCTAIPYMPSRKEVLRQLNAKYGAPSGRRSAMPDWDSYGDDDMFDIADMMSGGSGDIDMPFEAPNVPRATGTNSPFGDTMGNHFFGDTNPYSGEYGPSPIYGPDGFDDLFKITPSDSDYLWKREAFEELTEPEKFRMGMTETISKDTGLEFINPNALYSKHGGVALTDEDTYEFLSNFSAAYDEYKSYNLPKPITQIKFGAADPWQIDDYIARVDANFFLPNKTRQVEINVKSNPWWDWGSPPTRSQLEWSVGGDNTAKVLIHETGHLDHFNLLDKLGKTKKTSPHRWDLDYEDAKKKLRSPGNHGDWKDFLEADLARQVSTYGAYDTMEFVAEVYTLIVTDPETLTPDIIKLYQQLYGPDPFNPGRIYRP